jgi:hypothetical protein
VAISGYTTGTSGILVHSGIKLPSLNLKTFNVTNSFQLPGIGGC